VTINSDRDIRISNVETIWKLLMETLELTPMPTLYSRNALRNHIFTTQHFSLSFLKTDIAEKSKEREGDAQEKRVQVTAE
tara:strand:+ start:186 stop:425 length:240 start_codon:yes stop_codon:yes gene_type:complete